MAAITSNVDSTSTIPAEKLFSCLFLDSDNIVPKLLPELIKSVEIVQGDGGVGTIKEVSFGEAVPLKSMTHRVDTVDKNTLTYDYTIIGGDILLGKVESISNHFQIVDTDGGSIVKNISVFTPIGDEVIPEDNIKAATEQSQLILKAVEAYLLANPNAY